MTVERDLGKLAAKVEELERRADKTDTAIEGLTRDRWWLRGAICGCGVLLGVFAKTILAHLGAG